jgi:hypothetical protein
MGSWSFVVTSPDGVGDFVSGPDTPPLGVGSAHLSTGTNGDLTAELHDSGLDATPLADVTALGYSTYATSSDGTRLPVLALDLDLDGDGSANDTLFFDPAYQNPVDGNASLPDQGVPALGTWQTWDAQSGGWWSQGGVAGAGPGSDVKSLSEYLAVEPDATIVNGASDGVRLVVGGGSSSDVFDVNVDAFDVAVDGTDTTYDFEPGDTDGDGVGDDVDECPATDASALTVVVGTCDSGVANTLLPSGCSMTDLVTACVAGAKNHGKFVSCVAKAMNALKKSHVISGAQKGKIQSCAARTKTTPSGHGNH